MSASPDHVPRVELRGGGQIPQLGFGVFQVPPDETAEIVSRALSTGYRHIDTASAYRNEAGVGEAVKDSELKRADVFVTTKCWNSQQGYDEATRALHRSLERLQMDYVDLYLIHWPAPSQDKYVDTWKAFVDMQEQGLARSIGVSNFQKPHIERVIAETGVTPAVDQIELHPHFQEAELEPALAELGIVTESWSPLAQGHVLDEPAIVRIAEAHGKTPAQVVIRWHLQLGYVVFPKSVTPERIEQNFDVFDFELSESEMDDIRALDRGKRIGPDPNTFVSP
jgi:2,5-diketo-D-gluconate reductase A